jgi:ribosome-binding ATPase YchF (GTP1/OBG family)
MSNLGGGRTISFQAWLEKQMLHGKTSRLRTQFVRFLKPYMVTLEENRMQLVEENSEKKEIIDKKTKEKKMVPVLYEKDGKETTDLTSGKNFKIKDQIKFNIEFDKFMKEEIIIDVLPSIEKAVYAVKDIVLNSEETFSDAMGEWYEDVCLGFEGIAEAEPKQEEAKK